MAKNCLMCEFPLPKYREKFCSDECRDDYPRTLPSKRPDRGKAMATGTKGTIAELKVASDLLGRGYPVFRALSPACPCDLVILAGKKSLRIEVRSATENFSGELTRNYSRAHHDKVDIYAWVLPDRIVYEPEPDKP